MGRKAVLRESDAMTHATIYIPREILEEFKLACYRRGKNVSIQLEHLINHWLLETNQSNEEQINDHRS